MSRVCVIGSGYVGLVSGIGLAELGHTVACVDVDAERVATINAGTPPIHEVGLLELMSRHVGSRLIATIDLTAAVVAAELTLICVGTPSRADGSIDTTYVEAAAEQVGAALPAATRGHVVVVKSTVVPGTTDGVVTDILARASGLVPGVDFGVGANPEFLTEGQAVADFMQPDRIVIGGDALAVAALSSLYAGFDGVPVVRTNARTAEMTKYASNTMLATAISFANEIANLGAVIGEIDTVEVMRGVHLSRYLTSETELGPVRAGLASFYEAGCGYGGSCLPKDVAALTALGVAAGFPMRVLAAVADVNASQPARLVAAMRDGLAGPDEPAGLRARRVTVLGLAFKPDTDDVRFSPAFPVIRLLLAEGAEVTAHDPVVGPEALAAALADLPEADVYQTDDLATAVKGADAVVIVTRWAEYLALPDLVAEAEPQPLVVDGRRMLDRASVNRYAGIGL